MHEPDSSQALVSGLLAALELQPGDASRAYGEIHGSPATLTILGGDPLSVLVGYKIKSPHPESIEWPAEVAHLLAAEQAEATLEDGLAWLTLRDLSGETEDSTRAILLSFGAALADAGLVFPPGCVTCGALEDAELVFSEGRASRLCPECAAHLVADRDQVERQLNGPTPLHALGVPLAFSFAIAGWVGFWFLLDVLLALLDTEEIVMPDVIIGLLILVMGGLGFGLGYPLGAVLRRAGWLFRAPALTVASAVLPACLAGELLYLTVYLFWRLGAFEPLLALQLFLPIVLNYPPAWILGKLVVLAGISLGCFLGVKAVKKVSVRL